MIQTSMSMTSIRRREFIQKTGASGLGIMMAPQFLKARDDQKARIGLIGVGLRGRNHLKLCLQRDDVEVVAICDIDPQAIALSENMIRESGQKKATVFTGDEFAWKDLSEMDELDGVIISTPWRWHAQMAISSMKNGKYAGVEVPLGLTVQECWDVVNTSEETGMPCMLLENVCYRRDVMAVLNMVREGLFGEMIHLEGGYQHDLRHVKFNDGKQAYGGGVEFGEKGFSEAKCRTDHSVNRNGDLYPTHGIGPVAQYANINKGNRFVYLTSMATKSRGLHNYVVNQGGENHPNARVEFKLGDIVTTLIKTQNGETITLNHDTNLPRPYSLGFRVQGTKGIWMDINDSLYLEGVSKQAHKWEPAQPYLDQYDHPLWAKYGEHAAGAGHGGMDFFVVHAFVEAIKRKAQTPIDVYDGASWSVITPLSEKSIAMGSEPVDFPDFTKGKWMRRGQEFALDDSY